MRVSILKVAEWVLGFFMTLYLVFAYLTVEDFYHNNEVGTLFNISMAIACLIVAFLISLAAAPHYQALEDAQNQAKKQEPNLS